MTSPQNPWEQDPSRQENSPQQPGYPPDPQSGGFQRPDPHSGGFQQSGYGPPSYPQQGYPQGHPGDPSQGGHPDPYAAPPISAQEVEGPPRPNTIDIAFWIAVVIPVLFTVLSAVSLLLQRSYIEWVMEQISDRATVVSEDLLRFGMMFGFVFGLIISVVFTVLWVLFAFKMRAGRNWARITLTVFAGLWLFGSLGNIVTAASYRTVRLPSGESLTFEVSTAQLATSYAQYILTLLAMIAFIVLVYLKRSNAFFRAARR
ncbi:proline-rich domain-containing protein [Actinopolyspora xinjiangensis]|uniref:proline-rich domain-containing protein n=1 Tax=Actinopolyspora xinjiangensis TaxID=405564 RepID=UPI001113E376|nr:proline-rich domain-containing protein [Actinopolyspora xinjiangensis]